MSTKLANATQFAPFYAALETKMSDGVLQFSRFRNDGLASQLSQSGLEQITLPFDDPNMRIGLAKAFGVPESEQTKPAYGIPKEWFNYEVEWRRGDIITFGNENNRLFIGVHPWRIPVKTSVEDTFRSVSQRIAADRMALIDLAGDKDFLEFNKDALKQMYAVWRSQQE